ncbi:MAG: ParB N-terminal domain-containing protein, partial [Proteobacteria bacterium]|nr:ParB N-terminal domain-containing protein [Pseudomonadota bacterium]
MNSKTSAPTAHAQHTEEQIRVLDAVAALANSPTSEEDDALRASLERQGQLVPCLRHNGLIVDGRRRLKALQDLGREPWVVDIDA